MRINNSTRLAKQAEKWNLSARQDSMFMVQNILKDNDDKDINSNQHKQDPKDNEKNSISRNLIQQINFNDESNKQVNISMIIWLRNNYPIEK